MTSCRHHSGYLADDEAGHTTYLERVQPPKKPAFLKMGQTSRLDHMPHPPSMCGPSGSSGLRSHRRKWKGPQTFGSFLDFLVEGQVLDSLQRVVEEATERMATMKTETGVPLVEVQDPVEVPRGGRQARARPSLSTVHRHRVQPSLCTGHPNNYPSCSSSTSDSHSSITAGYLGSHSQDSNLGYRGLGPLPPMRDRLLQEKSLKRLLQLENRGKSLGQSCSQGDSLLWDSLGSSSGIPGASELGPEEREPIFLKREFNKEMKSLLSQPESFNLPGYSSLREPHRTLDFLAKHHLFPALQSVVSQAVDKFSGACRQNGSPLFPPEWEPGAEPNVETTPASKQAIPTEAEEPCDSPITTTSSFKKFQKKSTKSRVEGKLKERGSPMSSAQGATKFRLQVIPTEEPKSPSDEITKKTTLPSISSKSTSHLSNPCYEELVNYLMEQAVSLLVYKYKFETKLTKQLGFISFPITETLMDLLLGFKKVKGSHICLSSEVDWSCLLQKLEEAQWARQVPQQTSQRDTSRHTASHRGTSQHSTGSHSTLPKPAIAMGQKVAKDPRFHTVLPGSQLPTSQENNTTEEHISPTHLSEPKLSMTYSAGVGSSQSEQAVDMGESQSIEEEEEEEEAEEEEEEEVEEEEEDEDYTFRGENETWRTPSLKWRQRSASPQKALEVPPGSR
ncbi:coiled-coil domain-containing protein 116 [Pteronotus mesoamericanus]|uniref:coiled-coil domain-containing protein 116 n=1 Tax=Pteronotus mesoamericanus TaxID=1884717 RepID=UPI0023EC43D9|nr:coiled-coil domain-containing protein 116 [Pteronotus parnellii mesoamericanus]